MPPQETAGIWHPTGPRRSTPRAGQRRRSPRLAGVPAASGKSGHSQVYARPPAGRLPVQSTVAGSFPVQSTRLPAASHVRSERRHPCSVLCYIQHHRRSQGHPVPVTSIFCEMGAELSIQTYELLVGKPEKEWKE